MNDQSKYEETKENNKQKSVRNEFLYHGKSDGKYDFPIIKKQNIDISKIKFLSYCDTTPNDADNRDKTVHFLHTIGNLTKFTTTPKKRRTS